MNCTTSFSRGSLLWAPLALFLFFSVGACQNKAELSDRLALTEVKYHLENNPVYESASMDYGEMRFRTPADETLLNAYSQLESYGYVRMELLKERKRFLSKDSTLFYIVQLTDKAIPFVLEKGPSKAKVRTYDYKLEETQPVHIELSGKNRAKVTVTLKQEETDFVVIAKKNQTPHATFIKKTYNFRFDEQSGWRIIP